MMNWYGQTDNLSALLASAVVSRRGQGAYDKPALAAIGRRAAKIQDAVRSMCEQVEALCTTKAMAGLAWILSHHPGLALKRLATMGANEGDRLNPCGVVLALYLLTCKGIRRTLTLAVLIAEQVRVWHGANLHMPLTATRLAAKAGALGSVGFHIEGLAANLTHKGYHA